MAIGANSYGDTTEVAHLVPMFTDSSTKLFTTTTRPTLARVESFVDEVSAIVNAALAQNGFAIPVTQADAVKALSLFVNAEAASLVEGVNGSGRFGPNAKQPGSRWKLLYTDVQDFIAAVAYGLEAMGATRANSVTAGLAFREYDNDGKPSFPLFSRSDYGLTFTDFDPV